MTGTSSGAVAAERRKAWRTWSFFSVVCILSPRFTRSGRVLCVNYFFKGLGSEMFHACGEGLIEGACEE